MKRITRRQFAKFAAAAALAPAFVPRDMHAHVAAAPQSGAATPPQQAEAPKPEPKLKLTPEQEERVKQAVERRNRQLAAIRSRVLPYDAEPAFVFKVRVGKT